MSTRSRRAPDVAPTSGGTPRLSKVLFSGLMHQKATNVPAGDSEEQLALYQAMQATRLWADMQPYSIVPAPPTPARPAYMQGEVGNWEWNYMEAAYTMERARRAGISVMVAGVPKLFGQLMAIDIRNMTQGEYDQYLKMFDLSTRFETGEPVWTQQPSAPQTIAPQPQPPRFKAPESWMLTAEEKRQRDETERLNELSLK